jgi:hypothetical protein
MLKPSGSKLPIFEKIEIYERERFIFQKRKEVSKKEKMEREREE